MQYEGEFADKASHFDIVKNPEVEAFLNEQCEFIKPPSESEGKAIAAQFIVPPSLDESLLPQRVIATDGSLLETSWDDQLPSTKIGYVKVGSILINLEDFQGLRVRGGRMVDPFKVAALERNKDALTFPLPSANVRFMGKSNVRDGFRAAVDAHLASQKTWLVPSNPKTSLRSTLFKLASMRQGQYAGQPIGTGDPSKLRIHKCPDCGQGPIEVRDIPNQQHCSRCGSEVYPADCLRLWEEVSDYQSNLPVFRRFMLIVEHLLMAHYIRFAYELEGALQSLGELAFFVDGQLAIHGTAAWLHGSLMSYLHDINARLAAQGLERLLIVGLQKSGAVVDHVRLIDRFIPNNRLYAIDDEYRYTYIRTGKDPSGNTFGYETYYGQDFIYKTPSGRVFVFALPYPFGSKHPAGIEFKTAKAEVSRYSELGRALTLIHHFESDLYENALIPVALAHRYTAISLEPGGRVLNLLTNKALEQKV